MWGHVTKIGAITFWVASFYVPVFFITTGYLYEEKRTTWSQLFVTKQWKKVMLPYWFYCLVAIIPNILVWCYQGSLTAKVVLEAIYEAGVGFGGPLALWFLPSYFIATIVYLFLKQKKKYVITVSACSIIGAICFQQIVNQLDLQSNGIIFYPLCSLIRSMTGVFYICIGAIVHSYVERLSKRLCILLSAVLFSISFVLANINGLTNYSFLEQGKYPILLYVCGCLGSIGLMCLFKGVYSFGNVLHLVEKAGNYSLDLLATHDTWKVLTVSVGIIHHFWRPEKPPMIYIFGMIVLCLMILFEIPIVFVLNRYMFKNRK